MASPPFTFPFQKIPSDEEKKQFTRSACFLLFKELVHLNCSKEDCEKSLAKESKLHPNLGPKIAMCGHHVCYTCGNCDNEKFSCKKCDKEVDNHTLNGLFFPEDKTLKAFFIAIYKNGFACSYSSCVGQHPRYNSVLGKDSLGSPVYYCIWNAARNIDGPFQIIDAQPSDNQPCRVQLSSLDCEFRDIGCVFHECCFCAQELLSIKGDHLYLDCGHICHEKCLPKSFLFHHEEKQCKLCEETYTSKDITNKAIKTALPKSVRHCLQKGYTCKGRCGYKHPEANLVKETGVCVWCTVEGKIR